MSEQQPRKTHKRNYEGWCLKCGAWFAAFHPGDKFCCKKHRNSYNERRRQLARRMPRGIGKG